MAADSQVHGGIKECRRSPQRVVRCPSLNLKKRNRYAVFSMWLVGRSADGKCRKGSTDGILD